MTWYEEASREIWEDGEIGAEAIANIIAKHDPNRWIPVTERLPQGKEFDESGNPELYVEAFPSPFGYQESFIAPFGNGKFLVFSELYGDKWIPADPQPSYWREIVLPEVTR